MEIELCQDRSEEEMDWALLGDDLYTKEVQAKGEQGETCGPMFKGEFQVKQEGVDNNDQSQLLLNYSGLC